MAWTPSHAALAAITAGVVAAGAGAGILLQPTKERPVPTAPGPNVSIDVVAPREPVPEPGGVMEVGDLADGYTHRAYMRPPAVYPRPHVGFEDDPPARVEPRPVERPREVSPRPGSAPPTVIVERRERPSRWPFGFDQPGPDYAAERRERMARMEEQRRFEEAPMDERLDDRRPSSDPRDDRGREAWPDRDPRGRERQWYGSDGRRVAGPEPVD